jgi:dolichol-phosphate mannosyltransferase
MVTLLSLSAGVSVALWQWSVLPMLAAGLFFLGGVQLLCLGILGEYIGRIHNEVKGRPAYVVEELIGFAREIPAPLARRASEGTLAGASG